MFEDVIAIMNYMNDSLSVHWYRSSGRRRNLMNPTASFPDPSFLFFSEAGHLSPCIAY